MNNQWEIEWNSSQLRYGHDMGTVNFMLTKGADLRDINYVLFDAHDDSYEPLIKAVALRDNSHPDIILKEMGLTPEQMMQRGAGKNISQNMQAINAGTRLTDAQAAGQRGNSADYWRSGQYGTAAGNTLAQGAGAAKNVAGAVVGGVAGGVAGAAGAAKNWLSGEQQPGVQNRLGRFMQGVGDTARHGKQAWQAGREDKRQRREGATRRSFLESQQGNMGREEGDSRRRYTPNNRGDALAESQLSDSLSGINERYGQSSGVSPAEGEDTMGAMQSEIRDIGQAQAKPKEGWMTRVKALGNAGRMGATNEGEAADEIAVREAQVEGQMDANPEADEAVSADAPAAEETNQPFTNVPVDTTPPDTGAVIPTPAKPEVPQEPSLGMQSIGTGGMKDTGAAGKRVAGAIDNHEWGEEGSGNFDDHYNSLSQASASATGKVSPKAKASVIAALKSKGYEQAEEIVEAANQGDPEAAKIVEEVKPNQPFENAGVSQTEETQTTPINTLLSEDDYIPDWNMLMKKLNIR